MSLSSQHFSAKKRWKREESHKKDGNDFDFTSGNGGKSIGDGIEYPSQSRRRIRRHRRRCCPRR